MFIYAFKATVIELPLKQTFIHDDFYTYIIIMVHTILIELL